MGLSREGKKRGEENKDRARGTGSGQFEEKEEAE